MHPHDLIFRSSSRARDNFLFYIENSSRGGDEAVGGSYQIDNRRRASWDFRHDERSSGFTKQTYSAWVALDPNAPPRRWNLTAYFSASDYLKLPTVSTDPLLYQLIVPPNLYTTVQSLLRKSERRSNTQYASHGSMSPPNPEDLPLSGAQMAPLSRDPHVSPSLAFVYSPGSPAENGGYQSGDMDQVHRTHQPRSSEDQRAIAAFRLQL
ncbi:cAMP-independent regulatory protein pac2 [Ceratobasidium sp. AG-Ba]|nr:cAMP-independent regulatory protein pac2 [Ceratobasidium sp. AG-Ba]QRV99518.1 cAMP-independent regulatory protein pac2 [Ceratobasidium sp. AG-Ba]